MKRLSIFFLLCLVVLFGFSVHSTKAPHLEPKHGFRYLIKTNIRSPLEMGTLSRKLSTQGYDIAGHNWKKGEIEVITDDTGMTALNNRGLFGKKILEGKDLDPQFLTAAKVEEKLKQLNATYPQLTRLEQIGTSIQGRAIWALLISNTPSKNDPASFQKPSIIFDGVHHAREVMTAEVVMDVAEELLSKQSQLNYKNIAENWMVWVVPMLNVDGSNIVFTSNNWWRKNAHETNGEVHGVDLNRNYSFNWNGCNGSSGEPNDEVYRGTSGGSEPEASALMNLAQVVRPTASLSYHSYGELILYPFGCNGEKPAEQILIEKIAYELEEILPADDGAGNYTPGTPWELLYDVDGDSMDHIHASYGALAYTFEMNQAFQPEYSLKEPTVVKHRKAWAYLFDRMGKNLLTITTVNANTGRAEEAEIEIDTIVHKFKELPFKTNSAGKFFKVLDPGTYIVTAKLNSGKHVSASVSMTGKPQNITIQIQ